MKRLSATIVFCLGVFGLLACGSEPIAEAPSTEPEDACELPAEQNLVFLKFHTDFCSICRSWDEGNVYADLVTELEGQNVPAFVMDWTSGETQMWSSTCSQVLGVDALVQNYGRRTGFGVLADRNDDSQPLFELFPAQTPALSDQVAAVTSAIDAARSN